MAFSEQTINKFQQGLLSRGYGDKTRQSYARLVSRFLGFVNDRFPDWKPFVDQSTDRNVVETYNCFLLEQENHKPASANAALSAVARFFSIQGHSRRFKLQQAPKVSTPERLSAEEQAQLHLALAQCSLKHQCIILLFLTAGLRPQELSGLQVADLDLAEGRLLLRRVEAERTILLPDQTCRLLQIWLDEREKLCLGNQPLFANVDGLPISCTGLDFIVKTIGQKARLCLSARTLRNTYIKSLLDSQESLITVVERAGLKNVSSIWRHISK